MPTITEHARAIARATEAGDHEAANYIRQQMVAQQRAEDAETYNPTSGMTGGQKALANLGAGFSNFGLGAAQLALPKVAEHALGITDESINERRARDQVLADNTTGGKALQIAGEALPTLAVPGGVISKGLGAIPKIGAALKGAGVGSRVLPTVMAEGAVMGGLGGAMTPTTSDESVLGRTLSGAALGGAFPAALSGLGKVTGAALRPFFQSLQQDELVRKIASGADGIDISPQAQKKLESAIRSSQQRVVDSPQSLAALTQDPAIARMELAARASPETGPTWSNFDDVAGSARWKALDDALGNDASVKAAKDATDAYAALAVPETLKSVKAPKFADGLSAFRTAVQGRLNAAVRDQDPNAQQVYGYVKKALEEGGGTPQMLWNVRKTLSDWLEGTPPPGLEGTRGAKMDRPIMETRKAIDGVLNDATGNKWKKLLEGLGEHAQKETAQKAGQNIRNVFFDEVLGNPRGATTRSLDPAVTRAKLEQALQRFGKNDFGETLDYAQRNVIDQVLGDLRADEILQRAKSSMTGKGGSQTAPLAALMQKSAGRLSNGLLTDIGNMFSGLNNRGQQRLLNTILQSPEDALVIMRQAEKLNRPLTGPEKLLVQTARNVLASPASLVLLHQPANAASQEPSQ